MYQKIDRDNMFDAIWKFPNNLSDAIELGNNINLINDYNNISNIVIAGIGGSAPAGPRFSVRASPGTLAPPSRRPQRRRGQTASSVPPPATRCHLRCWAHRRALQGWKAGG